MKRTTIYLDESIDRELKRIAKQTGRSRAELIREGVQNIVASHKRPLPKSIGMVNSGSNDFADKAEDLLWADEAWPL